MLLLFILRRIHIYLAFNIGAFVSVRMTGLWWYDDYDDIHVFIRVA